MLARSWEERTTRSPVDSESRRIFRKRHRYGTTAARTSTVVFVALALVLIGAPTQSPARAAEKPVDVKKLESPPERETQPTLPHDGAPWSASSSVDEQPRHQHTPIREMRNLRGERSRAFDDGRGYVAFQEYLEPIHYNSDGEWVPIENTLSDDPDHRNTYTTTKNAWKTAFAPSDQGVTLTTPDGALTTAPVRASDDAKVRDPDVVKSPKHKDKSVEEQASTSAIPESAIVDYWRVWHDVDVRYELRGDALKEDIRVLSNDARSDYAFDVAGADATPDGDGGLKLSGPVGDWFHIAAPIVSTAAGTDVTKSSRARYEIRHAAEGSDVRIAVVIDDEWLKNQATDVFPLTIDPDYVSIIQAPNCTGCGTTTNLTLASGSSTSTSGITVSGSPVKRGAVSFTALNSYMNSYKVYYADLFFNRTDANATQVDIDVYDQGKTAPAYADVGTTGPFAGTKYECAGSPAPAGKSCLPAEVTGTVQGWFDQNISSGWFGIKARSEGASTLHTYQVFLDAELYYPPKPSRVTNLTSDQVLATTTPTLRAQGIPRSVDQTSSSGDPAYLFEITTGPNPGTGLVIGSGYYYCGPFVSGPFDPNACKWTVPKGALSDGMTYYAWVITNWAAGAPYDGSPPTIPPASYGVKFKVDLGLGNGGHFPTDEVGAVPGNASSPSEGAPNPSLPPSKTTVNLVDGNAAITVETPKLESVSGGIQLRFAYNSLAAAAQGLQGLSGEYYNDNNNNGVIDSGTDVLVASKTDPTVVFDFGTAAPVGAQDLDRALARWTGFLTLPNLAHTWKLGDISSDGIKITSGATVLLDDFATHAVKKNRTYGATFTPSAGMPLTIDWHHSTQNRAVAKVFAKDMATCDSNGNNCKEYALDPSWLTRSTKLLPAGWSMNSAAASARWVGLADNGDSVTVFADDGSGHVFTKSTGGRYTPPTEAANDVLSVDQAGQFVLSSGTYAYTFGPTGSLQNVASSEDDQHPAALQYSYTGSPALLRTITDPVRCAGAAPCPASSQVTLSYGGDSGAPAACSGAPTGLLCNIAYWDGSATSLYYSSGRLSQIANPGSVFYDFAYDTLGRVTDVRDPLAHQAVAAGVRADDDTTKTQITYDSSADTGRVSTITQPAPTSGAARPKRLYCYGYSKAYSGGSPSCNTTASSTTSVAVYGFNPTVGYAYQEKYDSRNRRVASADSAGLVTKYVWDAQDRQVAKTDPASIETSTEYDVLAHATKAYGPAPSASFDSYGKPTSAVPTTTKAYDEGSPGLAASWFADPQPVGSPKFHTTADVTQSWSGSCDSPSSCHGGGSLIPGAGFSGILNGSVDLPSAGRLTLDANGGRMFADDHLVVDQFDGPYASAVRSDRPDAWWRLADDVGSATVGDNAGSNAGTYSGGVTLGQSGPLAGDTHKAATFNGTTGTATIPDVSDLRFENTQPLSVELWFKTSTVSSIQRALVSKMATTAPNRGWEVGLNGLGQPYFYLVNTWNSNAIAKTASTVIASNGSWRHLVVTYDGTSASGVSFYIDGTIDAAPTTSQNTLTASPSSSSPLTIASRATSTYFFPGTIADVAVYDKQLAATEITTHKSAAPLTSQSKSSPIIYNTSYPRAVADDAPTSYWRLSEATGSTATDSNGSSNGTYSAGVTLNRPGPVPGDPSTAADFNGTNGYVSVPDAPKLRFNQRQPFSVEGWFKTSCSCPNHQILASKIVNTTPFQGWEVALASTGQPQLLLVNTWTTNNLYVKGNTKLNDGAWHHLAVTYDGSSTARGVQFVVDGRLDDTTTVYNNLSATPVSSAALYLASRANSAYWFNGTLSDIAVYPVALPPAAASAHHLAGRSAYAKAVQADSAISYWRLGETTTTSAPANDVSGGSAGTYGASGCSHVASGPLNGDATGAATFNGTACTVSIPNAPALSFDRAQTFSVDAWIKTSLSSSEVIASKMANASPFRGWEFYVSGGQLTFQFINTWSTNALKRIGSANVADGSWHHVAMSYDGSSQAAGVNFYVDGQPDAGTTSVDALSGDTTNALPVYLGSRAASAFYFNGSMSDVAAYSRAMTADQVAEHYARGKAAPEGPVDVHRVAVIDQQFVTGGHLNISTDVSGATFSPNYGHVTKVTDPDGKVTQTSYTDTANGIDPKFGLATTVTQDPAGANLQTKTTYESPGGASYLRRTAKTMPAGNQTTYTNYGGNEGPSSAVCGVSGTTSQAGLVKQRSDPAGRTENYVYDGLGRQVGRAVAGDWSCMTNDSANRITSQSWAALGGQPARTVTYTYAVGNNPLTNRVTDTNWPSQYITSTVDLLGRTTSYTDIWGDTTVTSFDQAGRVTDVNLTDVQGTQQARHTDYDSDGRVADEKIGGQTVSIPSYDSAGRLTSVSYPSGTGNGGNGSTLTAGYDTKGRQNALSSNAPGGGLLTSDQRCSNLASCSTSSTISDGGRATTDVTDGNIASPSTYTYDGAGRLSGATVPGHNLTYGYAATGGCGSLATAGANTNRTSVVDNTATTTYCYDQADRLTSSSDGRYGSATYDAHGNTSVIGSERLTYDGADRHVGSETPGDAYSTVTYRRDPLDRIVERDVATVGFRGSSSTTNDGLPSVSFRAASSAKTSATGASSLAITKPSGVVTGDVMLLAVSAGGGTGTTITPPSGWTVVRDTTNGATVHAVTYSKVATASEPSSYSLSFSAPVPAAAGIADYSGVDQTSPVEDSSEATASATTSVTVPSISVSTGSYLVGSFANSGDAVSSTMTQRWHEATASPLGLVSQGSDEYRTAPGSTGSRTASSSSTGFWVGHLVGLRPASGPTSITLSKPGSTASGDVMLAHVSAGSSAQGAAVTITPASGWTAVRDTANGSAIRAATFYKVAGGSEPSSYEFSFSAPAPAAGGIASYSGADTSTPIENSSEATSSSSSVTAPSIAASAGGRVVGLFGLSASSGGLPATMTSRWGTTVAGPTVASSTVGDEAPIASGATGSRTATGTTGSWVGHLLALKPATAPVTMRYAFAGHDDTPVLDFNGANVTQRRTIGLVGGVIVTRAAVTASSADVWSYPNVHGDIAATANGSGSKIGATFTYDPYGQPLAGNPDNTTASATSYGWEGSHQKLTEHQGLLNDIEMGARVYAPGLGRFLSVDPEAGGCANDYTYVNGDPVNQNDRTGRGITSFLRRHKCEIEIGIALAAFAMLMVATGGSVMAVVATLAGAAEDAVLASAVSSAALKLAAAYLAGAAIVDVAGSCTQGFDDGCQKSVEVAGPSHLIPGAIGVVVSFATTVITCTR